METNGGFNISQSLFTRASLPGNDSVQAQRGSNIPIRVVFNYYFELFHKPVNVLVNNFAITSSRFSNPRQLEFSNATP